MNEIFEIVLIAFLLSLPLWAVIGGILMLLESKKGVSDKKPTWIEQVLNTQDGTNDQ